MEVGKVIDRNLFWVCQNGNFFLPGKKHFTLEKKSRKMTLPPQKNMPVTRLLIYSHWVSSIMF